MSEEKFVNVTTTVYPPNELPYLGQVYPYKDAYWTVNSIAKMKWINDPDDSQPALRVSLVLKRVVEEQVVVTDKELKKAKKSNFRVVK